MRLRTSEREIKSYAAHSTAFTRNVNRTYQPFQYNTYGNLPNANLLRRYGHVDVIPDSEAGDGEGNPADEVEIPADLSLNVVAEHLNLGTSDDRLSERIEWWLEEGGDE